jgi:L-cysteine desulfidase
MLFDLKRKVSPLSFNIKDILSMEVSPALGCTEPSAIALAAAAAAFVLPKRIPESIRI